MRWSYFWGGLISEVAQRQATTASFSEYDSYYNTAPAVFEVIQAQSAKSEFCLELLVVFADLNNFCNIFCNVINMSLD